MGTLAKKQTIEQVQFMRTICAIGIVAFHFCIHSECKTKLFYETANGSWGFVLVTIFFAISGGVLYYNYPVVTNIRRFYYKRWISIFPAFYICYLYCFIQNTFNEGGITHKASITSLILTIFGVDGYFLYRIPNYYIIGEWFLGALIILYLIYPLLVAIYNRVPLITTVLIIVLCLFVPQFKLYVIAPERNLLTCLGSFFFGMVAIQHKDIIGKITMAIPIGLFAAVICFVPIQFDKRILQQALGVALFIVLFVVGKAIMKNKLCKAVTKEIDKISYEVFLFQHFIILKFLGLRNPESVRGSVLWALLILAYIIICAKVLSLVVRSIRESALIKSLDARFTADKI